MGQRHGQNGEMFMATISKPTSDNRDTSNTVSLCFSCCCMEPFHETISDGIVSIINIRIVKLSCAPGQIWAMQLRGNTGLKLSYCTNKIGADTLNTKPTDTNGEENAHQKILSPPPLPHSIFYNRICSKTNHNIWTPLHTPLPGRPEVR